MGPDNGGVADDRATERDGRGDKNKDASELVALIYSIFFAFFHRFSFLTQGLKFRKHPLCTL